MLPSDAALHPALQIGLLTLVVTAAIYDLRFRRVPNWLTLAGVVVGVGGHAAVSGWAGCKTALAGLGLGFGAYLVLYLLQGVGAGDVKLMAAVGAIAGSRDWLLIFLFTAMSGGLLALIVITMRGRVRTTLRNIGFVFGELLHLRQPFLRRDELSVQSKMSVKLPHAISIAAGSVLFLLVAKP